MNTRQKANSPSKSQRHADRRSAARRAATRRRYVIAAVVVLGAVAILFGIYASSGGGGGGGTGAAGRFEVGSPSQGRAPAIKLASTKGGTFDLAAERGKTVLLYFQEGVGCQPCWNQIRDLEKSKDKLSALGIDELVSITGNDLSALRQKVADEQLVTTVLADPDLAVSKTYHANEFGMMGTSADGHTFIVVGPDGAIRFRADYGGAPKYTMYVSPDDLLADLRAGLGK